MLFQVVLFCLRVAFYFSYLGPDHLAAVIPNSIGKPGWHGAKLGAIWGFGHGCSAMLIGLVAYLLKGEISQRIPFIQQMSQFSEKVVGISLVAIGFLGILESYEIPDPSSFNIEPPRKSKMSLKAILLNGFLHGVSWDGAPSIASALVMSSWKDAALFLSLYSLGTVISMGFGGGLVGILSTNLGKMSPDFPRKLSLFTSSIALLLGMYWLMKSFVCKV
jgi:hypothetical protein